MCFPLIENQVQQLVILPPHFFMKLVYGRPENIIPTYQFACKKYEMSFQLWSIPEYQKCLYSYMEKYLYLYLLKL